MLGAVMSVPTDAEREAAQAAIDAMQRYFDLRPHRGAVQWIEDSDGRVVIFTRGEYRSVIMEAVANHPTAKISEVEYFEIPEDV